MPESLANVLRVAPTPADKEHPPGSRHEGDVSDGEGGGSGSVEKDALATRYILNVNTSPKTRNPWHSTSLWGTSS